jgi:hypothetical protein
MATQNRSLCKRPFDLLCGYRRGFFTVRGVTARRFELRTAPSEIGSALLADAEHYLDCAAEHQVSLWRHINSTVWLSPAWLSVTFYYWAFFLCLAMTRLLGETVWFLDRRAVRSLLALAPTSANSPGAGCFLLRCGPVSSLSERELTLTKGASGRVHDELWLNWSKICESKLKRLATGSSTSLEERLFTALVQSSRLLGSDWPSAFRNAVNYQPAFAYAAVRREQVLKSVSYLRAPLTYECPLLLDRFEANLATAKNASAISENPQTCGRASRPLHISPSRCDRRALQGTS